MRHWQRRGAIHRAQNIVPKRQTHQINRRGAIHCARIWQTGVDEQGAMNLGVDEQGAMNLGVDEQGAMNRAPTGGQWCTIRTFIIGGPFG